MGLNHALLISKVVHARHRPKQHRFQYGVYYLCVRLNELALLERLSIFSRNRFNLLSLHERDYGRGESPQAWMRELLSQHQLSAADGEIVLVTLPRVLGYAFNPVSFWFCLDREGAPRAVLADVTNTFGERHAYLLYHDDQRPITQDDLFVSEKVFHVSPFMEVNGHYQFRFAYSETRIGVWIEHHDAKGLLLTTSVTGKRTALTSASLLTCFFRYPLVTFKVIGLIHYQALRLTLKGIRYRSKPLPPITEVSR